MSTIAADVRALVALNLVPGIGTRLTSALLARFGSAAAVLGASAEQLQQVPHIGGKLACDLVQAFRTVDIESELELMTRHRVWVLSRKESGFPASLIEIPDPPHLIYGRGELKAADSNAVALVGSRSCTTYGRRIAHGVTEN